MSELLKENHHLRVEHVTLKRANSDSAPCPSISFIYLIVINKVTPVNKVLATLEAPSFILIGGFIGRGVPVKLIGYLRAKQINGLTLICSDTDSSQYRITFAKKVDPAVNILSRKVCAYRNNMRAKAALLKRTKLSIARIFLLY